MAGKKRLTEEEYERLYDRLYTLKEDGTVTDAQLSVLLAKLDAMAEDGDSKAEIERALLPKKTTAPDPGDQATARAAADLEKKFKKVYGTAAKELKSTLSALEKDYQKQMQEKQADLKTGKITSDEFNAWVRNKLMRQKQVKELIDQCTGTLLHANEKAMGMVNGERLEVFAENANYQEYQIDQDTGLNLMFSIYDTTAVERLLRDEPNLLPPKKVNGQKDKAWNYHRITDAVTQAIIQGESIPKLAKRIAGDAASSNAAAMMRYARTAMTGAQNAGRMEMLHRAQGLGIKCRKRWMATLDSKTRDSHADLDGEVVGVDDEFSNGLMFPGDPNGDPGEVYNCRCTMTYEYDGIDNSLGERRDNETGKMIPDMTYREWKRMNSPEPERKPEKKAAEKKEEKKTADDFDAIMKKVEAMEQAGKWEDEKKNLLPLGDKEITDQAHKIYMSMTDPDGHAVPTTLEISKLKTEQAEVFTDRLEELAEAFNGRKVSGARTEDFEGITVAKWRGEYIVLDGNNRTNLAILKGQKDIEVMLIDMDNDSELKERIDDITKRNPVQGKDITDTWQRRPDEFAFEIEDVINAQGFDGLPRIMDPEDFDKAVKESGFIAQRTYSASTQEEVDLYRDMLYNGKFYVDCSTGGAQYGQGMYCAADYTGTLTDGIKSEMAHYQELNDERFGGHPKDKDQAVSMIMEKYHMDETALRMARKENQDDEFMAYVKDFKMEDHLKFGNFMADIEKADTGRLDEIKIGAASHTETFTLTKDAKIITYDELRQLDPYREAIKRYAKQLNKGEEYAFIMEDKSVGIFDERYGTELSDRAEALWKNMTEKEREEFKKDYADVKRKAAEERDKVQYLDEGALAALYGYDAINAEGHGESGSYTVILNRTKCIFRRDTK